MNIQDAWRKGFTGKGVVVTVLDDGIEKIHPDLIYNYVSIIFFLGKELNCEKMNCVLFSAHP